MTRNKPCVLSIPIPPQLGLRPRSLHKARSTPRSTSSTHASLEPFLQETPNIKLQIIFKIWRKFSVIRMVTSVESSTQYACVNVVRTKQIIQNLGTPYLRGKIRKIQKTGFGRQCLFQTMQKTSLQLSPPFLYRQQFSVVKTTNRYNPSPTSNLYQ